MTSVLDRRYALMTLYRLFMLKYINLEYSLNEIGVLIVMHYLFSDYIY